MQSENETPAQSSVRAALDAFNKIVNLLEPLSAGGRARVLLMVVLSTAPDAFSNEDLWSLLQRAKQP